jgi:hypothetical protein
MLKKVLISSCILSTFILSPSVNAQQAAAFKANNSFVFLYGLQPNSIVEVSVNNPSKITKRRLRVNPCGFAKLQIVVAQSLNLPTITSQRADFSFSNLPTKQPLLCIKNTLYFPRGFSPKDAIATAINANPVTPSTNTTNTINSQNAQPVASKKGNYLIVTSIPPGTYIVANATNPNQKNTFTVSSKACLISDRTIIGSPTQFLISRQGLTFPISWNNLQEITNLPICN